MRRFQRKLLVPVSVFRTRVGTFRARTGAASGSRWSGLKRSGWCSGSGSIHDLQAGEGFCFWNENMEIFCKSRWWIAKNLTYLLTISYYVEIRLFGFDFIKVHLINFYIVGFVSASKFLCKLCCSSLIKVPRLWILEF